MVKMEVSIGLPSRYVASYFVSPHREGRRSELKCKSISIGESLKKYVSSWIESKETSALGQRSIKFRVKS